ncbi:MAG: hypothetical protein LBK98_02310 [Peptococcaceae bacterium]|nr:hypothetical protein [Peptococcaceae bacterium]
MRDINVWWYLRGGIYAGRQNPDVYIDRPDSNRPDSQSMNERRGVRQRSKAVAG